VLSLTLPPKCRSEAQWISSVILGGILNVAFETTTTISREFEISYGGKRLTLPDLFFSGAADNWLQASTLPKSQLPEWNLVSGGLDAELVSDKIPVLYGRPGFMLDSTGNGHLGLDVFGSAFFMLSRYEEAVLTDADRHDRFPAIVSTAYRAKFLNRPIVDEYVEILWSAMTWVWPELRRKRRTAEVCVSCDVDQPYSPHVQSAMATGKRVVGDIVRRKDLGMAVRSGLNAIFSRVGNFRFEPNNVFDWIMDVNESAGNRVTFYFMAGQTVPEVDGNYSIGEGRIRMLMRRIFERGHEIGLHGSYGTYKSSTQFLAEANRLRMIMHEEGIRQDEIGNRQHYLRWSTPETARNLERAGIVHDATLGYAETPGFRCGTSHEYRMFDVIERRPLKLRERPLVVMENSVIDETYLGLGHSREAFDLMSNMKSRAMQLGGTFTLLWHNSSFMTPKDREMYCALIGT